MTKTTQGLSPALILLMSVATGLAVASNYYAQPLLDTIARAFDLSASSAGFIVTAAQLGYAAGLLFLVPLGDMFERRMLIVSMTLLAAAQQMYSQLEGMGMTEQQASGWLAQQITNQGLIISANEIFWISAGIFIVLLGLVWFAKPPFGAGSGGGGAH